MDNRNARLLFVLSLFLFALVFIVYWYSTTRTTFRVSDIDFSVQDAGPISRIEMHSFKDGSTVVLQQDEQGRWRLNNVLFANELAVNEIITVLGRIMVWQPVSIANRQQVDRMLTETGTQVRVYVQSHHVRFGKFRMFPVEKLYQTIEVGDDAPGGESTYMRKAGAPRAFKVIMPGYDTGISYVFDSRERVWRDPVVIDAHWDEISSVTIVVPDNENESFMVRNDPDREFVFFTSDGSQELLVDTDVTRVRRFLSSFRDVYFESLLDEQGEALRKEIMFEQPFMEITVQLKNGSQTHLQAFARHAPDDNGYTPGRDPNRFYVRVGDGEFAIAQYFVFNRIMRPLSFFKNKGDNS